MNTNLKRRKMLSRATGGAALAATRPAQQAAAQTCTIARIIIGAGGTALVNQLDGARITLLDARVEHLDEPGLLVIAAGRKPADYEMSKTTDWLPDGATLMTEAVAAIDEGAKIVSTALRRSG